MTKATVGHMFKHYERSKDENGEYIKFGNQEIDTNKSHLNYNLAPGAPGQKISQGDLIKKRCSEVYCFNRKDVNVACSWVVTLPKDFEELNPDKNPEVFFQNTYDFLENRYGKDNVISSYVHLDETTPHMHFCFVPITYDEKKDRLKVSAKEVVNMAELKRFHGDLHDYLHEKGLIANVLNDATKEGNKSIDELKRNTAKKELDKINLEVEKGQRQVKVLENDKKTLKGQIERLEGKVLSAGEVEGIKITKPLFGNEKSIVKMEYQDAVNLQQTAKRVSEVDNKYKLIEKKERDMQRKQEELKKEKAALEKEREKVSQLSINERMEIYELREQNSDLKNSIKKYHDIFRRRPDLESEIVNEMLKSGPIKEKKGHSHER